LNVDPGAVFAYCFVSAVRTWFHELTFAGWTPSNSMCAAGFFAVPAPSPAVASQLAAKAMHVAKATKLRRFMPQPSRLRHIIEAFQRAA
jgi:hypothetical protein